MLTELLYNSIAGSLMMTIPYSHLVDDSALKF